MRNINIILALSLFAVTLHGCSKQDEYLDKKYNLSDVIPTTLQDFQGLLDNNGKMNAAYAVTGLMGTDNFFLLDKDIPTLLPTERNSYLWNKDVFEGNNSGDWSNPYVVVFTANVVLEGLQKLDPAVNAATYNQVKGSALFYRAFAFFNLAQTFAKPYSASAAQDPGIVLRETSDVNVKSDRATLADTYNKIIKDLTEAESLLPSLPLKPSRPSKASVYGLLAKTYLHLSEYDKVEQFASKALSLNSNLLDYNKLPAGTFRFSSYSTNNPEYIFYATSLSYAIFQPLGKALVDTFLYRSYEATDTRKAVFYQSTGATTTKFKGSYTVGLLFAGIATNELFLLKSEAQIRQNNVTEGLKTLNTLLEKRFTVPYTPKTAATQTDALTLVLSERRKELPFTGLIRWEDLRRLNQDPNRAITLKRIVNGSTLTLSPNDNRYVMPIPDNEIRLSGITQNNR